MMTPFTYARPLDIGTAITQTQRADSSGTTQFIAGGTNLLDLMKQGVERSTQLVDINRLPLSSINELPQGGLRLGALATNADTAYHPLVQARYPLLSQAILAGASPQLRNKATNGGNLFQRTRCYYFYDTDRPCNKRSRGSGCSAIEGFNRIHAILGTNTADPYTACIATHPSDMCVALAALDALVRVTGPAGERTVRLVDLHRLAGDEPELDTRLRAGELVTAIDLPAQGFANHFTYLKLRDRTSYAFALVSVAVGLAMKGDQISAAQIALGGVAHKPWRKPEIEALLVDTPAIRTTYERVADALLEGARGFGDNNFKIDLAHRAIIRALGMAAGQNQ